MSEFGQPYHWKGLLRSGSSGSSREENPNLFYPILIDETENKIIRAGNSLPLDEIPDVHEKIDGFSVAWPIRSDGSFGRWMLGSDTFNEMLSRGLISLGNFDKKRHTWGFTYLTSKYQKEIETGELKVVGRSDNGQTLIVEYPNANEKRVKTVWHRTRHDAGAYGTDLIGDILCGSRFTFPKSLYAVLDTLKCVVSDKPNAIIIDFFAGSGTTLHAVNLLNAEDGGHRRCVCVTNNEVSSDEQKAFVKRGLRPGDPDWEAHGIARYVTWPRTKCSIEGVDVNGEPLKGDYGCPVESYDEIEGDVTDPETGKKIRGKVYKKVKKPSYPELADMKMSDGFKANAIFFDLTYQDPVEIELGAAFHKIAPLLWLKAGSFGKIIYEESDTYSLSECYGVLFNYSFVSEFIEKVQSKPEIRTVFIVTDDEGRYASLKSQLPDVDVVQLYESYLRSFRIAAEDSAR